MEEYANYIYNHSLGLTGGGEEGAMDQGRGAIDYAAC